LLTGTLGVLLIGTELVLRFGIGKYSTYPERNGLNYQPIAMDAGTSRFHVYHDPGTFTLTKAEFVHSREISALGLTDQGPPLAKQPREFRVLALGDSFTEGVGTTVDSTWIRAVARELAPAFPGTTITTFNAGISGSDPAFQHVLLTDRLLAYRPDLVVLAINTSDVTDLLVRGGMERFAGDSIVIRWQGPSWQWLYGISYIWRHLAHDVLHYNWLLVHRDAMAAAEAEAVDTLGSILDRFVTLSSEAGFRLLLVFHPMEYQVRSGTYQIPPFDSLVARLGRAGSPPSVNLLDRYLREGLLPAEAAGEYFWKSDLHHNGRGYALMGKAIAEAIMRRGLVPAQ
jgi:lysophospholipase L1-like esterase